MTLPYQTLPADIDHMIENDFAVVERQFEHLEAGRGDRRLLVDQIGFELALHAFAVEQVLYPAFEETGQTRDLEQARERNNRAKELLSALLKAEPGSPEFESALTQLMAGVREQHAGSDAESLPTLREKLGAQRLAQLGKEFLAAKRKAPTAPHPHAPDKGLAERVAGALAKPLDEMKSRAMGIKPGLGTDASGLLHPQAQAILDAHSSLEPLPFEICTAEQARQQPGPRQAVQKVMAELGLEGPEPVGSVEDLQIPDGAGGTQTLRVYKPEGVTANAPVIFWIHGGGWVLFTIDDHYDDSCRGLVNKTGAIVVTADYRRAPEAVFPASHDDVLAAYRWTVANAASFGGDPARIGIGGESVGGNMSAATVLQLAQAGESQPVAQVLVYPVTTAEQFGESMSDAADARPLNRPLLSWMAMHAFEDRPEAATDPRINLLGWTDAQLSLMPPTLVITDERDVLRSQGQEFARKLHAAGVDTRESYFPGAMHEFFGAAAVFELAEQAQQDAAQQFLAAFGSTGAAGADAYPSGQSSTFVIAPSSPAGNA
ncbi:MAG: putative lipase [Frankiales bacterium]|nr:putative lipase [Frankiales bacterium]